MVTMDAGAAKNPKVELETNRGKMVIELYPDEAPKSVENFLSYVDKGFYDGTIFHRVIPRFMIQGGGFDQQVNRKLTSGPIENEAKNGLSNERGTIAMARTSDPDSATSQFFINVVDNGDGLDEGKTGDGHGYTVFGKVIDGLEVADEIALVETKREGGHQNLPVEPVILVKATRK